jgi:hypothetical protein
VQAQFEEVFKRNPDAVRYQIIDGELYRVVGLDGEAAKCKHKERCEGIEFAILKVRNVEDVLVTRGEICSSADMLQQYAPIEMSFETARPNHIARLHAVPRPVRSPGGH